MTPPTPSAAASSAQPASAAGQEPHPENILKLGTAFWASKTLLSAVELELFTHLSAEPGTAENLQQRLGLHPRSTRDFLDTLVALGMLQRENGVYANTPDTALFLDKNKPSYIGGILEMSNARLYPFWAGLTDGLKTGLPQNEVKNGGDNFFHRLYSDPERLHQFLRAMTGVSRGANLAIASTFPWDRYHTFVDVGTAQGDLAGQVALAHPHLRGTGFDLPEVEPTFAKYMTDLGLSDRVKFAGGNFFEQPLPKADVIMMGHILHDWNLEEKKQLIKAAWTALPSGGAFIAYDSIIDDDRRTNAFGLLMSLNMLIETPGGFDYTGADCMGWMKAAGFRETRVQHLVGPDSMVVGIK
ncbi:MAG TPA: methyltransferase [Opitutus sp.]|nr:methyltransferase [Opitutus sp.]